ncbi:Lrp/AsnC family transcriptional regulator [Psychrosphaera sp. B3R10]|uniref:Lrp/AsnC family transcriptional regulator n=1 Tax=unclassified Psychrosphaera TaxID=2641570 RepID=UPI001C0A2F38|nr:MULTISPECIES: Lrp/AsnC family transcriptional regulator [unclassified Psychrosphaera]MBU2883469.1 Lrp/AsnC family transcriptional regulator [Psychrosphaera sp. I2R16]MBU2990325.1 Lrp/AsnC family transcriptional regulator [Psychrosphaera sp. B3R10]MDO6718739.1 Lrp/AsnC family transcriptional regulator [Psychrosphaera sp. 1_MG-2023]
MKKSIKIDTYNKKILATLHLQADLTNVELAEIVNLSPSACFQRVKSLKEAGYFRTFHADVDLDQICEHILAYIEFTLDDNSAPQIRRFTSELEQIPEIMDCMQLSGDVDFISLSCFPNLKALNDTCNVLSENSSLSIKRIKTRIVLERTKWFLGYPLEKLKWLDEH